MNRLFRLNPKRLKKNSAGTSLFLREDGTFAAPSGGTSPIVKVMGANQSLSSTTTLATVTDLVFAIGANEVWVYRYSIQVGDDLDSTGLQLIIDYPAGSTGIFSASLLDWANSTPNQYYSGSSASLGGTDFGGSTFPFVTGILEISVSVDTAGTAGNVSLQFAPSFNVGANLTFKAGSFGIGHKTT